MINMLRIVTAIATFSTGVIATHQTTSGDDHTPPPIELIGLSTEEQEGALRDVALFVEAGLPLPPVTIRQHHDRAACNGHEGLHHVDGMRSRIDICMSDSDAQWIERTILHELTHAWAFHFLTSEHEEAFQRVRGWEHWLDYDDAAWEDNGAEQAAEIMVWALSDHPVALVKIDQGSCKQLHDGYVALTGLEPLHGYTNYCDSVPNVRRS